MQRRTIGILAAAAAAYGIYRYAKMSPEQKRDLKAKGKNFLDKNVGQAFKRKGSLTNGNGH